MLCHLIDETIKLPMEIIMNKQRIMPLAGLIVLSIFLAGCTASRKTVSIEPSESDLRSYSAVVLSVESNVTDDVHKEMTDLERLAVAKIKALNIFQSVQLGNGEGAPARTLIVKTSISKMRKVSGKSRFMVGAFAGRASMIVDVTLSDAVTKESIGSYSITGQSGGTGVSGGTSDAIDKAAEGIADLLAKNYRR